MKTTFVATLSIFLCMLTGSLSGQSLNADFDHLTLVDPTCVQINEGKHFELISESSGSIARHEWFTNHPEAFDIVMGPNEEQPFLNVAVNRASLLSSVDVTLVVHDSTGGTDTLTKTIPTSLHFAPIVNFAPRSKITSCTSELVRFTDMAWSPMGEAMNSYEWSLGNENTSNEQEPQQTYNKVGTYNINLTVTDDTGCASAEGAGPTLVVEILSEENCN